MRVVALMAAAIVFYLLTVRTVYLRQSNFGRYIKQFAYFYASILGAVLAELVLGCLSLVRFLWFLLLHDSAIAAWDRQSIILRRRLKLCTAGPGILRRGPPGNMEKAVVLRPLVRGSAGLCGILCLSVPRDSACSEARALVSRALLYTSQLVKQLFMCQLSTRTGILYIHWWHPHRWRLLYILSSSAWYALFSCGRLSL